MQEKHDAEVEDDFDDALEAVFGNAVDAGVVGDGDFGDAGTVPIGVDGNEAVHLAVEGDALEHFTAVYLQ